MTEVTVPLTRAEEEELNAIGRTLDLYGEAMDEAMYDDHVARYNALQEKRRAPSEPDVPFLSIRKPGDIRPVEG